MDIEGNEEIINEICSYAEEHHIKELLGEYLKRIVLEKPQDPVKFLLKSIQENPFDYTKSNAENNNTNSSRK
jgi:hypothetical protein